jgi:integrase
LKNKDLIIKTARRLDKFNLDEMIVVSELDEKEVSEILSDLVKQQIVLKNNNTYFFNTKKSIEINNTDNFETGFKPIIIEEEEGYDRFLSLGKESQERVRNYIELLNFTNQAGGNNSKQLLELFNQTSGYKRISLCTFGRLRINFKRYGLRGILPAYSTSSVESSIPNELFDYFKKYYLNNEKLSATDAIYKAQKQLQAEQKIEQPYAYASSTFLRKLKSEFTPKQIEYFRNNITPIKEKSKTKKEIKEPLNMFFKDAAKIYFNRLKAENKFETIMHQKTDYNNHLTDYFDDLRIREITNKVVAKFKQKEFDGGYQLASVNTYIRILKNIINSVCPQTNYLVSRNKSLNKNIYAMDMNLLTEEQIAKLLALCYKKYPDVYPILYISLSTGASIPELLGLTWDKIDFKKQIIFLKYFLYGDKLVMTKCNSTMRRLKIDWDICNILENKYYEFEPETTDFVFKFENNKQAQQYIEEDVLLPLAKEIGVSKLNPSDIQHNFVNLCLKQSIPLSFIQKSLGYYGITNFVKVYRDLIEKLEKDYYNPLEKILENKE